MRARDCFSTRDLISSTTLLHLLPPIFAAGLLHSFNMPTIGNLYASLRSPTLRFSSYTSLCLHYHARIERIPLVVSRTSSSASSSSKIVVSGKLERFPLGYSDFGTIRQLPGFAYFDKTEFIPEIEKGSAVQLVCRPRRFGKSLNVTTLRYFHGFQFRNLYDKLFKVCALCARFACTQYLR